MLQFLALIIFGLPFPNVMAAALNYGRDLDQQAPLGLDVAYDDEEALTITLKTTATATVTPTHTIVVTRPTLDAAHGHHAHYGGLGYDDKALSRDG